MKSTRFQRRNGQATRRDWQIFHIGPAMSDTGPAFFPGLLFLSTPAGTRSAEKLVGRNFGSLAHGSSNEVIAVCEGGLFGINTDGDVTAISGTKFVNAVNGLGYFLAVSEDQSLYSWGVGCAGGQVTYCV
jgi:hypothetical protein